jgi:hypothetical protein
MIAATSRMKFFPYWEQIFFTAAAIFPSAEVPGRQNKKRPAPISGVSEIGT